MIKINHKVAIYLPDNDNKQHDEVERVSSKFANLFGGVTIEEVKGIWKNHNRLVRDIISKIWSYNDDSGVLNTVLAIAEQERDKLHESSVLVEYDNTAYIV